MVDTVDSKSTASKACGFESHLPYQLLKRMVSFFYLCGHGGTGRRVRLRGVWIIRVSSILIGHTIFIELTPPFIGTYSLQINELNTY